MAWQLNPALTRFRNEVNARWPERDKASDGTIGDQAHQVTNSDHNPDADGSVDAWDMDNNVIRGDSAASDRVIYGVLIPAFQKHEAARYWIYQRKIAHRDDGWRVKAYNGDSPHTEHVHWNSNQSTENSTKPWLTEGDDMSVETDALEAILSGSGSGSFNVPNNLHVKINLINKEIAALKTAISAPANVSLSEAQLDALAGKVINALKSGAFRFEEEANG